MDEETMGEITESRFVSGGGMYPGPDTYYIKYTFSVYDVPYTSRVVAYEERSKTVEQRLQQYPAGKMVKVYYQSTAPRYSVLEQGELTTRIYMQLVFNLLMVPLFNFLLLEFVVFRD
jgi:hypothetical protein